jgi:hypothetical protein
MKRNDMNEWKLIAVIGGMTCAALAYRVITGKGAFLRKQWDILWTPADEKAYRRISDDEVEEVYLPRKAGPAQRLAALESKVIEQDKQISSLVSWASQHWHKESRSYCLPTFTPGDVYNEHVGDTS